MFPFQFEGIFNLIELHFLIFFFQYYLKSTQTRLTNFNMDSARKSKYYESDSKCQIFYFMTYFIFNSTEKVSELSQIVSI